MLRYFLRRLLSTSNPAPRIPSNVPYVGHLLQEAAQVKNVPNLVSNGPSVALIPRQNPFLRPVEAWLRSFQTFRPQSIIQISPHLLDAPIRKDVMHRIVVWHRACQRAGTASSKNRSEVAGSRRKIRPQKGTGKARVGNSRAPQRRGGGAAFGPKPRDFGYALNPKIRNLGLRSALTAKYKQGELTFVDPVTLAIPTHKTAQLADILSKYPASKKILLLDIEPINENLRLASQSLQKSFAFMNIRSEKINVYHVLNCNYLLITPRAMEHFEGHLTKGL